MQITAEPADINVLPEYNKDPRVVGNLLDGVNRTRDDMHLWLAPFTEGKHHRICLSLQQHETLAMIRIWVSTTVSNQLSAVPSHCFIVSIFSKSLVSKLLLK